MFSNTPILPLTWWWEYANDHGFNFHLKAVALFLSYMVDDRKHPIRPADIRSKSNAGIEKYGLISGTTAYVWVRNNSSSGFSENGIFLRGLIPSKNFQIDYFDTRKGVITGSILAKLGKASADIAIPIIPNLAAGEDIAIRVTALISTKRKNKLNASYVQGIAILSFPTNHQYKGCWNQ